jgi:maltokinase
VTEPKYRWQLELDPRHALVVDGPPYRAHPAVRAPDGWRPAEAGDGTGTALLAALAAGSQCGAGFRATTGSAGIPGIPGIPGSPAAEGQPPATERPMGVDQTNMSWIVGDVVVKWVTQELVGPHPAADRLRRLDAAGFAEMPALRGLVEWCSPTGHWIPVASVVDAVTGAEDGWTWCVEAARADLGLTPGPRIDFASQVGALTARMHLALADAPEPPRATGSYANAAVAQALTALDDVSSPLLDAHRQAVAAELGLLSAAEGGPLIAVHGDYHVGQVLRSSEGGYLVVDFDGNPTLAPAQRAALHPAAMDVAGMLMSLENVGYVVRKYAPEVPDADVAGWTARVQAEFLTTYRAELAAAGQPSLLDERLLGPYQWLQICRELAYARDYLPNWYYVPEGALRRRLAAVR